MTDDCTFFVIEARLSVVVSKERLIEMSARDVLRNLPSDSESLTNAEIEIEALR